MTVGIIRIEGPYTTAERDALTGMPPNMMILNTDNTRLEIWNTVAWVGALGESPGFSEDLTCNEIQVASPAAFIANGAEITTTVMTRLIESIALRQGSDVAAANNLELTGGNLFEITGSTQINLISRNPWAQAGIVITLLFASTPTVKHGQATSGTNITIRLAGAADFVATAGDTLTLALTEIGGVEAWREIGRAVI